MNEHNIETLEYQGIKLTPISEQKTMSFKGIQQIDLSNYLLKVKGMVDKPLNFTYDQLLSYPTMSKVTELNCGENWNFTAKWTGIPISLLLNEANVHKGTNTVIFYAADGYSTALDLDYLIKNDILLAYKTNDITLPQKRGFPLQLVAQGKYGYKWVKWITEIEVIDKPYKGYWESQGYSNKADIGGPRLD